MAEPTNAHEADERRRIYLAAVLALASNLELSDVLDQIVKSAADLLDARYAALGVLNESATALTDFRTYGIPAEDKARIGDLPSGHGILGLVITNPRPLRLPDLKAHPASYGFPPNHPPMTSFLGVPIVLHHRVFGNLYLTDKRSGKPFDDDDEEVGVALAAAAAVAIENSRLHSRLEAMAIVEDRERIARDLHDTVIQRLFAVGMSLQAIAQRAGEDVGGRIDSAVNELDTIIKDVRSAIFRLEEPRVKAGLIPTIEAVVSEVSRVASYEITADVQPDLDQLGVSSAVRHSFIASMREGLSNVARHADAEKVVLRVGADDDQLFLDIQDDGPHDLPSNASSGKGLRNAEARAQQFGGTFRLFKDDEGKTHFEWKVPRVS